MSAGLEEARDFRFGTYLTACDTAHRLESLAQQPPQQSLAVPCAFTDFQHIHHLDQS